MFRMYLCSWFPSHPLWSRCSSFSLQAWLTCFTFDPRLTINTLKEKEILLFIKPLLVYSLVYTEHDCRDLGCLHWPLTAGPAKPAAPIGPGSPVEPCYIHQTQIYISSWRNKGTDIRGKVNEKYNVLLTGVPLVPLRPVGPGGPVSPFQ